MKKIILFIIVFFGILPLMHKGKLSLINTTTVYADTYAQEDCDPNDPNGDCYNCNADDPDSPCYCASGNEYQETTTGSDNCFTYISWTNHYWDCESIEDTDGSFTNALTSLTGATLTLSAYSGNVNDAITLTASSSISGQPNITYRFQEFDSYDGWVDIASDTPTSTVYIIDQSGESPFRVIATSDCGGTVTSDEEDFIAAAVDCDATASLSNVETGGKPSDNTTLFATISGNNALYFTNVKYKFQAHYANRDWDLTDYETSSSYTYTSKVLGDITFKVLVEYDCEGSTHALATNSLTYSQIYCANDFISAYTPEMDAKWTSTINSTIANQGTKYEYGFVVWFDGDNFGTTDIPVAISSCGTDVTSSHLPYTVPGGSDPRYGGYKFYLGGFHTHPPLTYCTSGESSVPGPSIIDLRTPFPPFPLVVRTYISVKNGGHYINDLTKDYPYGNQCTTYSYP